jgi:hypothetical protein
MRYPAHLSGVPSREIQDEQSKQIAVDALSGVGDAGLGEWIQEGNPGPTGGARVWHVRRRLSTAEQAASGLSISDLRGTDDGTARLRKLFLQFPHLKPLAIRIGEYPGEHAWH